MDVFPSTPIDYFVYNAPSPLVQLTQSPKQQMGRHSDANERSSPLFVQLNHKLAQEENENARLRTLLNQVKAKSKEQKFKEQQPPPPPPEPVVMQPDMSLYVPVTEKHALIDQNDQLMYRNEQLEAEIQRLRQREQGLQQETTQYSQRIQQLEQQLEEAHEQINIQLLASPTLEDALYTQEPQTPDKRHQAQSRAVAEQQRQRAEQETIEQRVLQLNDTSTAAAIFDFPPGSPPLSTYVDEERLPTDISPTRNEAVMLVNRELEERNTQLEHQLKELSSSHRKGKYTAAPEHSQLVEALLETRNLLTETRDVLKITKTKWEECEKQYRKEQKKHQADRARWMKTHKKTIDRLVRRECEKQGIHKWMEHRRKGCAAAFSNPDPQPWRDYMPKEEEVRDFLQVSAMIEDEQVGRTSR